MSKIIAGLAAVCLSVPAYAASKAECQAMLDDTMNMGLGMLSDSEAARYLALMRSRNYKMPVDDKLTPEIFFEGCEAGVFTLRKADQGAPLKGANSLTEGQVTDLVIAHGFLNVVSLTRADDGIWHGRAMKDGESFQVAIDFKGNVVPQRAP
jgi:hypothetical protein